ncbi:hypothetical protein L596_006532 [Steinernema carpocapsae]|uniref:Uncharacterized protein n=1 Tax=Steinernema carpocapsae TaxID=34508 RepID=A0A4U8V2C6_STECR|nr:hypothetical protein L596_006532 [Steinernema carpocapsae]
MQRNQPPEEVGAGKETCVANPFWIDSECAFACLVAVGGAPQTVLKFQFLRRRTPPPGRLPLHRNIAAVFGLVSTVSFAFILDWVFCESLAAGCLRTSIIINNKRSC